MGTSYSIIGTLGFQADGFRNYMHKGFVRHSKKWNQSDLDVNLSELYYNLREL